MAKNLGTFTFAANLKVKAAEALDPRMVAASKADLIKKENWPSDGDTIYVYKGLIVDCGADGVYRLIDESKALSPDYSGWERIDVGGVKINNIFTYKGSVATYDALPYLNNVGDVYNVEASFTITDSDKTSSYPAGTNVAWNGTTWDPLSGSVDLSEYATKAEVADVRAKANANTQNITTLSQQIGAVGSALENKVTKEDGKSLIPNEKLTLIDATASMIGQLQSTDSTLDTRLKAIESAFTGEGGTVNLGNITTELTSQGNRITALETASSAQGAAINQLNTTQSDINSQLQAIVDLNTQQTGQIVGLTQELTTVKNSLATNTGTIATLNTSVGSHTQSIASIQDTLSTLKVKSVEEYEKVLSVSEDGALRATLTLDSYKKENGKTYIKLSGIQGAVISEFDASAFVKDGMINSVQYDPETQNMTITWNTDAGKNPTVIPLSGLIDTYNAGSGLVLADNTFAVKVDASENNKLTLTENGLFVDISDDIASVEARIAEALSWTEVN